MAASTASRLLKLFARREPTTDTFASAHGLKNKQDTVFYKDKQCTQMVGRKPWHQSGHPRSNSTRVIINCYEFGLVWA